jgi:hypothetical protein
MGGPVPSLLPTPTTQDGANNGGPSQFERNSPPLNAQVLMLPTPQSNLAEHGRAAGTDPERRKELGRQVSLADVTCHMPGNPLLPTPDAYAGTRGGSADPDVRRARGQTVSLADVSERKLMPTPTTGNAKDPDVVNQMATRDSPGLESITGLLGMPEETWNRTNPERFREDSAGARRRAKLATVPEITEPVQEPLLDIEEPPADYLLSTPDLTPEAGNTGWNRTSNRTRGLGNQVKELAVQDALPELEVEASGQTRMFSTPDTMPERANSGSNARHTMGLGNQVTELDLLRTPTVAETMGGSISPATAKDRGQTLKLGGQIIDLVNPGQLPMPEPLMPTPRAAEGMNRALRPATMDTSRLEDAVAVNLMPTPTVLDNVEKRTTHAGGGLTLQGVVGGVNPVDAARMERRGVEVQEWKGLPTPRATDGEKGGPNQRGSKGDLTMPSAAMDLSVAWGDYEPAIRRWEAIMGRPAPAPTEITPKGSHRLSARFTEWMMGQPDGWITDPDIGISRNDMLKACGNGVVTQQAIAALEDMLTDPGVP